MRSIAFLILFTSFSIVADGQVRDHARNTNAWLMYFGNHKVKDRFGIHAEVQLRRHSWISESQQLLARIGVDYYTKSNSRFTFGYAFVETYPYGEFAVPNRFPEHRIWQQFLTTQAFGTLRLSHRYRLEQRMIGNAGTGKFEDGRFENRMRYMARVTFNLSENEKPTYLAFYDEVFVNFGKDVMYNIFDQNRLYGALGFTITPTMKLEVGYLYQLVQLRSLAADAKIRMEDNHTLQLGIFSSVPWYRAEGK